MRIITRFESDRPGREMRIARVLAPLPLVVYYKEVPVRKANPKKGMSVSLKKGTKP